MTAPAGGGGGGSIELATAYITLVASAQGAGADAAQVGQDAGDKASKSFGVAFAAGMAVVGAAAVGVGKGLYEVGAIFDDVADTIRVGTGATGAELDSLAESAAKIGTTVPVSFETASGVVSELNTRLGLSGDTLERVGAQYAAAGNLLGEDVNIQGTTAAFSAFGIAGADVEGAMDRLYQVSQATGVGFNDLAASVQSQAPALQELGFSFEEATGLVGNLDKAGLNADAVMKSLGKGLVTLAKDGEAPQEAFERITGQVNELIAAGDTAGAIDLASGIFGTKGATQFVAAVESGTLATANLGDVAGITSDTILQASADTADAAEQFVLFKNTALLALKPAGDAVFGAVGAAMAKATEKVGPLADRLNDVLTIGVSIVEYLGTGDLTVFDGLADDGNAFIDLVVRIRESVAGIFDGLSGVGSSIGPVLAEVGAQLGSTFLDTFSTIGDVLGTVFAQLGPIFAQLLPALAPLLGLLNPVTLVLKSLLPILPVLAEAFGQIAVAVGGALVQALGQIAPLFPVLFDAIAQIVQVLATGLMSAITAVVPVVLSLVDVFSAVIPIVVQLVSDVLPQIAPLFVALVPAIVSVVESIATFLVPVIEGLLPVVTTVFEALGPIIQAAMDIVAGIIQVVTGLISGDWSAVWEGIKSVFQGIWDGINAFITGALEVLKSILSAAWEAIKPVVEVAWNLIKDYVITPLSDAKDWVANVFSTIGGILGGIWEGAKVAAKVVLDTLYDTFIQPFVDAKNWVSDTFSTLGGIVSGIFNSMKVVAGIVLDTLYETFIKPFVEAKKWVTDTFQGIVGIVQGIVNGIKGAWQDLKDSLSKPLQINSSLVEGTLGIGSIPGNATGGVYDPRPGGHIIQVAEAGEKELVTPTGLMRSVFTDVLQGASIRADEGPPRGGGITGGGDLTIITQDPDVLGALDQVYFEMAGAS